MQTPYQFFLANAGYGRGPNESEKQARMRCARELAKAERKAAAGGFTYVWSVDPLSDSSDFEDSGDPWQLWQVCMLNSDGRIVASLHGIDFGRDGSPWGDNYRRVVEAEIACDGLTNEPQNIYGQRK